MGGGVALDATALARAAAVVRHRGHVDDRGDLEADGLEAADGGVAAEAGTADADLHFLEAVGHRVARGVLGDHLGGVGRGLARTAEVALAGRGPGDDVALRVRDGNDGVVEGGRDVRDAGADVLRTLGLADLDRSELFLQEIFRGRGLRHATDEFNGLRVSHGSSFALGGLGGLRGLGGLGFSSRSGSSGAVSGGSGLLRQLFLLGSRFIFGHGDVFLRLDFLGLRNANGLARALAGAGVGAGALTTDGQAAAVTDAAVAIDRLEALQVAGDLTTKITLHHPLVVGDDVENLVQLLLGKIRGAHVGIETGGLDDEIGPRGANTVDIPEGVSDLLFGGKFDAEETRHGGFS